jgi:hypothetical protein
MTRPNNAFTFASIKQMKAAYAQDATVRDDVLEVLDYRAQREEKSEDYRKRSARAAAYFREADAKPVATPAAPSAPTTTASMSDADLLGMLAMLTAEFNRRNA